MNQLVHHDEDGKGCYQQDDEEGGIRTGEARRGGQSRVLPAIAGQDRAAQANGRGDALHEERTWLADRTPRVVGGEYVGDWAEMEAHAW